MQRFDVVGMTPPRGRLGHSVPTPRLLGKPLADVGPLYQTRNIARVSQLLIAPTQQLHLTEYSPHPPPPPPPPHPLYPPPPPYPLLLFVCFFFVRGAGKPTVKRVKLNLQLLIQSTCIQCSQHYVYIYLFWGLTCVFRVPCLKRC